MLQDQHHDRASKLSPQSQVWMWGEMLQDQHCDRASRWSPQSRVVWMWGEMFQDQHCHCHCHCHCHQVFILATHFKGKGTTNPNPLSPSIPVHWGRPHKGHWYQRPWALHSFQSPLSPSTPANPARQTLISRVAEPLRFSIWLELSLMNYPNVSSSLSTCFSPPAQQSSLQIFLLLGKRKWLVLSLHGGFWGLPLSILDLNRRVLWNTAGVRRCHISEKMWQNFSTIDWPAIYALCQEGHLLVQVSSRGRPEEEWRTQSEFFYQNREKY